MSFVLLMVMIYIGMPWWAYVCWGTVFAVKFTIGFIKGFVDYFEED